MKHSVYAKSGLFVVFVASLLCFAGNASAVELFTNGGMEQKLEWEGVPIGSSTVPKTIEAVTAEKHSGRSSLHLVIARGGQEWPAVKSPEFATETGKTYRVHFWAKVLKGAGSIQMRNGSNSDYVGFYTQQLITPEWTEYTATYNEKNGGSGAFLAFFAVGDFVDIYVDDVSISEIDVSKAAILVSWKKACPGMEYICWQKNSPWTPLQILHEAPKSPKQCKNIRLAMGRNEYESTSFVITNLTDETKEFSVSNDSSSLQLTLRLAEWITAFTGKQVNDALPLLEGKISIPSGESRELWITVNSKTAKPGQHHTNITISSPGLKTSLVYVVAKVYPVTLPDDKPVYTYYWDFVVPTWSTPERAKALMWDLKNHYVNVAIAHPWSTPRLVIDESGKLVNDYTELDKALENYNFLNPKMIVFNWNAESYFETNSKFMSDEWKVLFGEWLTSWVKHMKVKGYGYEKYAMYPYDESLRPAVLNMVKLIKQVDPKLQVFVNNTGSNAQEVTNIAPYVDIWCPYLYDYLNNPPYDGNQETKKLAISLLKKSQKTFWTYANPPGNAPEEAPPYRDYRLAPWKAWKAGMMGYGYWIYCYKTHWDNYKSEDGPNWSVVYLSDAQDTLAGISKKELIITSKRWEATREGIEDIVYLQMLKNAVNRGSRNAAVTKARLQLTKQLPAKVLANESNPALADSAKEQILEVLSRL